MKYRFAGLIFLLLIVWGPIPSGRADASGGIRWHAYGAGMELGKKENKKIFLHFWSEGCDYCKLMEAKTFSESTVIAVLNKHFISVKVNSDKERALASEYQVRGLPDNWFIAEKNEIIGNHPGYIPPGSLLPLLKFIYTDSYKTMSYKKFMEMN